MRKPLKQSRLYSLFLIILSLIPILVLEFGLRLAGYGESSSLFIPDVFNGTSHMVLNPDYADSYFRPAVEKPHLNNAVLNSKKPDSLHRIFLAGTDLFYSHNQESPAVFLMKELKKQRPGDDFEIVNVSLPSLSSFIVKDIVKEATKLNADMIILGLGEAEFYGALGSASKISINGGYFIHTLFCNMKNWRIFQLVRNAMSTFTKLIPSALNLDDLASNPDIVYQSDLYLKTRQLFLRN
ncbi:MAG: hypothetical protein KAI81_00370 [Candidatus Marinimicrobia bacterium]|nr:hypothetical protein [Candidatus Neomarinimicrobiota bacterium]